MLFKPGIVREGWVREKKNKNNKFDYLQNNCTLIKILNGIASSRSLRSPIVVTDWHVPKMNK